jgi:hypothetical protein
MKKLLLNFLLLVSLSSFAQNVIPFRIQHCIDKMTDIEYYFSEKKLICANAKKTKGFTIAPSFKVENGKIANSGFLCENVNIGNCDENDSLIFLFNDNSKLELTSWNKFNCEGNVYFSFSESDLAELSSKKVNTIRFNNGYSYESLTVTLKKEQQNYFIRAYNNQQIVEVDCSK